MHGTFGKRMTTNRIIGLIDMDCFYVQCEQRLQAEKWSKPCAVAQYNKWSGGGLIAVNYEARPYGIKRGMRGDDAKKLCPDLHVFTVPEKNGKADLDRYRMASAEVFNVISEFIEEQEANLEKSSIILERASIDEAFIDFTKFVDLQPLVLPDVDYLETFQTKLELNGISIQEWLNQLTDSCQEIDMRLIMGAILMGKIRRQILEKTQFKCSAGISYNKMLAKLACSLNKPNAQTILPRDGVATFFERVKISDVRLLGGKLGNSVKEQFQITTMKELNGVDRELLEEAFGKKTAAWLHSLSSGHEDEEIVSRKLAKSIGCGKNFPGKSSLVKPKDIQHWVKVLCEELHSRLENDKEINKRIAKTFVVGYLTSTKNNCSKTISIDVIDNEYPKPEKMASDVMNQVFAGKNNSDPILNISIAASKFIDEVPSNTTKIDTFFTKVDRNVHIEQTKTGQENLEHENKKPTTNTIDKYFDNQTVDKPIEIEFSSEEEFEEEPIYTEEEIEALKETFFFKKLLLFESNV